MKIISTLPICKIVLPHLQIPCNLSSMKKWKILSIPLIIMSALRSYFPCMKTPWVASGDDSKGRASVVNAWRLHSSLFPIKLGTSYVFHRLLLVATGDLPLFIKDVVLELGWHS